MSTPMCKILWVSAKTIFKVFTVSAPNKTNNKCTKDTHPTHKLREYYHKPHRYSSYLSRAWRTTSNRTRMYQWPCSINSRSTIIQFTARNKPLSWPLHCSSIALQPPTIAKTQCRIHWTRIKFNLKRTCGESNWIQTTTSHLRSQLPTPTNHSSTKAQIISILKTLKMKTSSQVVPSKTSSDSDLVHQVDLELISKTKATSWATIVHSWPTQTMMLPLQTTMVYKTNRRLAWNIETTMKT